MKKLLGSIVSCTVCAKDLPHGPRPVISVSAKSKILIIGQAPGRKVHDSGIPWNDKSGMELRSWLDVTTEQFYDTSLFAIMPMGFCYPGKGKGGDLPPLPACAPHWHPKVLPRLKNVQLILLIGSYAQRHYLGKKLKDTLTETVRNFSEYLPPYFPLVHPSPRNGIWQRNNPWFKKEVVPELQRLIRAIL